jgi:hypothetical protein
VTHANFDLLFSRAGDAYQVRVIESPAGSTSAIFAAPFQDVELENVMLRVAQSRRVVRRTRVSQIETARNIGGRLFKAVFTDTVRDCFRSSLSETTGSGGGLRLRLRLTDVPEIAGWPWEFLYDESLGRFLALSVETPIVRYTDLPERIEPLTVTVPLRILLIVASPTDHPALDVDRECANLTGAVGELVTSGGVQVDRVDVATLGQLQRVLSRGTYHIFHFIGHGALMPNTGQGQLMFEDDAQRGAAVDGDTLGMLLHDHRSLRIAVLNACEGARTSRTDPFSGVAQSLVRQGIPSVVAMQFEISDEAAIRFSREFYAALALGQPVDCALAESRKAIFADVSELEWATPVLYLRSPDARVFHAPPERGVSPSAATAIASPSSGAHAAVVDGWTARLGLTGVDPSSTTSWALVTGACLLVASGLAGWAIERRWFNLWFEYAPFAWAFRLLPIAAGVGVMLAAVTAFVGGRSMALPPWLRLLCVSAGGAPSLARLGAYASAGVVAAASIATTPPTFAVSVATTALGDGLGWQWIQRQTEGRSEAGYREVAWYVGAGSASDPLRLELRLEPFDSVWIGGVQVQNVDPGDVRPYDPNAQEPFVISRITGQSSGSRGRLRFHVSSDSSVPVQEKPTHVQVDIRIVREGGETVARWCQALPAQWSASGGPAGPSRDCAAAR